MHPRERFAWVWLGGLVLVPATYFFAVIGHPPVPDSGLFARLAMLAAALTALAAVALGARLLSIGTRLASEALVTDERDRRIEARSTAASYQVLIGGMILVGFVMPFSASKWELVDTAFLAIVLAEIVHYSLVLRGYRKGLRA